MKIPALALATALAASTALVHPAAAAPTYTAVISFGDSLSDAGNDYRATETLHAIDPSQAIEPVSPPYSGGRFSNGKVWVQYLAAALHLTIQQPFVPFGGLPTGLNFADGGALAGAISGVHSLQPLDLPAQLTEFGATKNGQAPATALYTLSIGGNDLIAILSDTSLTPTQQAAAISTAVSNETTFLTGLAALGARHILVMNVPDLSNVPEVKALGPLAQEEASLATSTFNNAVAAALPGIIKKTGANIKILNVYKLVDAVVASPASYGFTNVTQSCWTGNYSSATSGTLCSTSQFTQNQYLFWDSVHPTTHAHSVIANHAMLNLP